jgi:hypothetical protein
MKISQLLFRLFSNLITIIGILYFNWNFFTIIYIFWFAELIGTLGDRFRYTYLFNHHKLDNSQWETLKNNIKGNLFFVFIYYVFIVVIVGFLIPPKEQYIANIQTIMFVNQSFNINLLFIVLSEVWLYIKLRNNLENFQYNPQHYQYGISKRSFILHVSIIFGTILWAAIHRPDFIFQLNLGEMGNYIFIFVFVVIKILSDLYEFFHQPKKLVSLSEDLQQQGKE